MSGVALHMCAHVCARVCAFPQAVTQCVGLACMWEATRGCFCLVHGGQHRTDVCFLSGCEQVEYVYPRLLLPVFVKVTDAVSLASLQRIKSANAT